MKHVRLVALALAVLCPLPAVAQIVVTAPTGSTTLKAADDFATRAFQDPWDMSQKTDVGPLLGSADVGSGWNNIAWANGLFSGTTAASNAQLWLLDTASPGTVQVGKTGANYPIDLGTYKVLVVRMHHQTVGGQGFAFTWPGNIYESSPTTVAGRVVAQGWNVYYMDLSAQSGLKRAFRFDPAEGKTGENVSVDWARLVSIDPSLCRAITWTGPNTADIYLDNDNDVSNGYIGLVQGFAANTNVGGATRATPGCATPGSGFNLYVGGLSAGTYRVFLTGVGVPPAPATASYSPGTWTINGIPTLQFTSPTTEGSDDDFAASQLGDAWDMDKLADIDAMVNVSNPQITTITAETPEGASVPNTRVFLGTSAPGAAPCPSDGDPQLTLLSNNKRGLTKPINTDRYRLLTVEFGIPNAPRDLVCGSIARVIWRQKGDLAAGSVSEDIIFNQRGGVNLVDKITLDLKTTNVEQGTGAGAPFWVNGGQGGVDIFRFDPHEFSAPRDFYVKRIKLADFERAKDSYTIRWNYSEGSGTVDLYYDNDRSGFDGVVIATGVSATAGQYAWTIPASLPTAGGGTPIYIYAIFRDSTAATGNENRVYAPLPVYMDASYTQRPRLVLSRTSLNFGAQGNTTRATGPQTVRLTFIGPATTTPCWTISADNPGFQVSPTSGTGNATITVSIVPQTFPGGGSGVTTFTVNEAASCAGSMLNPGQQFTATFRITSGAAPIGAVDTPADNLTGVTGSLGVTGWVVDDIDITGVRIYRTAAPGEPADGLGRVFLGNASRVDDARPDVAAANPTAPFNYRGGWGYLLLTNFLPNLGNGTFVLSAYATDIDGHETLLGQRTVSVANSTAVDPFGAIDTPGQGESVTGSVNNFGWVLMRGGPGDPHADPPHGGAVSVVIDGAIVGSPTGWVPRGDLSALFPKAQFDGVDNALGVYTFNSAAYQDGVHTIAWVVVASNGKAAGIGSRFFTTVNGNAITLSDVARNVVPAPLPGVNAFSNLGRPVNALAALDRSSVIRAGVMRPSVPVAPDATGLRTVFSRGLDRVVVDASAPGARSYEAYQVAGGTLTSLPVGASFDERRGVLYWQPGVAFTGSYDFVVVRDGVRVPVRVVLTPERGQSPVNPLVRGLFAVN